MAKDKNKKGAAPTNNAGRPTGSYSSYGTSGYGTGNGYGYGASGGGAYGRSPYGAYRTGAQQSPVAQGAVTNSAPQQGNTKVEKVDLGDKNGKMTHKQKKLAKKAAKFDETDLRCYPMTVRAWIGTLILLAIPLVGGICAICWFFGVGNKSRAAWIRSYVVIVLLIVLIIGIAVGSLYGVLTSKAKNTEIKFEDESYGVCGDYGFKGTLYYSVCGLVDLLGPDLVSSVLGSVMGGSGEGEGEEISGEDAVMMIKMMLAQALLGIGEEDAPNDSGSEGGITAGGGSESSDPFEGGEGEYEEPPVEE